MLATLVRVSSTYFSPHLGAEQRDCRTCRYSIGRPDGVHLWCERHRLVVVFPCGWWERQAGTEQSQESLHADELLFSIALLYCLAMIWSLIPSYTDSGTMFFCTSSSLRL